MQVVKRRTAAELPAAVRVGAWPTLLAAIGASLYAGLHYLSVPVEVVAPVMAAYAALCAIFNPLAGEDQPYWRLRP